MAIVEIHVPDELRQRMDNAGGEDWSQIAREAFEGRLERLARGASARWPAGTGGDVARTCDQAEERREANDAYDHGYAWARDRAIGRDLRAMVNAPNYRTAVDIVRATNGFSQRDEFGDGVYPSDEMWEAFVDGATARFNESSE